MKKKLISIILSMSMIMGTGTIAFATENNNIVGAKQFVAERSANIVEQVVGTEEIDNDILETATSFKTATDGFRTTIPKDGREKIETVIENIDCIGMTLPKEVAQSEGVKTNNGTIVYDSKTENVDVTVQTLEKMVDNTIFSSVRTMITIGDATAPKEYDFNFDLPIGYRLITSSDYAQLYYPDNNQWIGENLVFIIDKDNNIVSTIDEAWAKDAKGNAVATHYEINGCVLTQVINFNSNSAFPIIADPTNTGVKIRTENLTFTNSKTDQNKLVKLRNDVNARQNSSFNAVVSFINAAFGLFNIYTGIASVLVASSISEHSAYLERCEDAYTEAYFSLTGSIRHDTGQIDFSYRGTYQGQNKGYVYRVKDVEFVGEKKAK